MGKNNVANVAKSKKKDKGARRQAKTKEEQEAMDLEIAGQVKEIEERLQTMSIEMKTVEAKIRGCTVEAKRAELTEKELQPLADDSNIYRQVGRMWIQQPKADLVRSLRAQCAVKSVESQSLKQALDKIKVRVNSEADSLRELIGAERFCQLFSTKDSGGSSSGTSGSDVKDSMIPIFGKAGKPVETSDSSKVDATDATTRAA